MAAPDPDYYNPKNAWVKAEQGQRGVVAYVVKANREGIEVQLTRIPVARRGWQIALKMANDFRDDYNERVAKGKQ